METYTRLGWQVGFFTLTYNQEHVPTIPIECFKNPRDYKEIMCFNKNHIKELNNALKKHLHHCFIDPSSGGPAKSAFRIIVCSEYGARTRRSHYHGLIWWNPSIHTKDGQKLTPQYLHNWLQTFWDSGSEWSKNYGFIFPEKYDGSGKHDTSPFACNLSNASNAAFYTAKYTTKDIYWWQDIDTTLFKTKIPEWKNAQTFHFQSKGLGKAFIEGLDDDTLYNLWRNGYTFSGSNKPAPIPLYIKNKIFFTPFYYLDKRGKRHVSKKPTEFYKAHSEEIFDSKARAVLKLCQEISQEDYLNVTTGYSDSSRIAQAMPEFGFIKNASLGLAKELVAYGGVRENACFQVPLHLQYESRFYTFVNEMPFKVNLNKIKDYKKYRRRFDKQVKNILHYHYCFIQRIYTILYTFASWQHMPHDENDDIIKACQEFFKERGI